MDPATTDKYTTLRTNDPNLVAMTQDEFEVFVLTAILKQYQIEFGTRATGPDSPFCMVAGTQEQVESALTSPRGHYYLLADD